VRNKERRASPSPAQAVVPARSNDLEHNNKLVTTNNRSQCHLTCSNLNGKGQETTFTLTMSGKTALRSRKAELGGIESQ
jgi:hypothetical protein